MYIVIIDKDQSGVPNGNRMFLGMTDDWEMAPFDTLEEIVLLKEKHSMGVFTWLVIDISENPVDMTKPPYSLQVLI